MTETASKDINGSDTALSVDDRELRQRFIRRWDWMPARRLPADRMLGLIYLFSPRSLSNPLYAHTKGWRPQGQLQKGKKWFGKPDSFSTFSQSSSQFLLNFLSSDLKGDSMHTLWQFFTLFPNYTNLCKAKHFSPCRQAGAKCKGPDSFPQLQTSRGSSLFSNPIGHSMAQEAISATHRLTVKKSIV